MTIRGIKPPLERTFKIKVHKFLRTLPNTWFTKTQERSIRGIPDYLACINGMFVGLELKRSKKEKMLGTLQDFNIEGINEAKGFALFVYPENFEQVKETLLAFSQRSA